MAQTDEERKRKAALRARVWYAANLERARSSRAAWRAANRDTHAARNAAWALANPDRVSAARAAWLANNPEANRTKVARRRASRLNATPKWLGPEHHAEILDWYRRATASGLQVDHIIPLRGKSVCGLHVPWNMQLLSPSDNNRKGNNV